MSVEYTSKKNEHASVATFQSTKKRLEIRPAEIIAFKHNCRNELIADAVLSTCKVRTLRVLLLLVLIWYS